MKTLTDILLPYQKQFVQAPNKRKIWVSSRQIGKSFSLGYLASYKALSKINGLSLIISTGSRAASEMIRKCVQFAEAVKYLTKGTIDYTNSADSIKFSNGSRILSLPSGNPAALRGFSAQCVLMDEAQYIDHPEDVMAAIAPTLTRDPDAEFIMASTPAGKNSWFYNQYMSAINDPAWYVQKTSIYDAVKEGLKIDIDNLKSLCPDPDVWKQEYEAEFLSEYSSMIDLKELKFISQSEIPKGQVFFGVDIGSTGDRTAIAICYTSNDKIYVYDIVILKKASYEYQLQILKDLYAKYQPRHGYIDANGIGNPVAEFANKQISQAYKSFTWTASNKTPAYEYLRSKIFDRQLIFADHLKNLIETDFQNIDRIINEAGVVKYVAGRNGNGHSDATSALVLALQGIHEKGSTAPNIFTYRSFSRF